MRIKYNTNIIFYILLVITIIARQVNTKIVYRDDDDYSLVKKENFIVYHVGKSIIDFGNFLQDRIRIFKKWYYLFQENSDYFSEHHSKLSSNYIINNNNNNNNHRNGINSDINNDRYEKEDADVDYPNEVKIFPNMNNPELYEKMEVEKEEKRKRYENYEDEDEELNIERYHYSMPDRFISSNDDSLYSSSMQSMGRRIFKRDDAPKACNPLYEHCEATCRNNKGVSVLIDESLDPMYNCSGKYLMNFTNKKKLPLTECNKCNNNKTCLNFCCELMDTTINKNISKTVLVETLINNTLTNTTAENPELKKICYCPIHKYGANCQYFYDTKCDIDVISPKTDCFSPDGKPLKGLKYYEKENNCKLYNYTDIITVVYNLTCYHPITSAFNLSLSTHDFNYHNESYYELYELPLFLLKPYNPIQFNARLWNFNHVGLSIDLFEKLTKDQLIGNQTIEFTIDLGKYYYPDDRMRSIFNGGRVVVEAGFTHGFYLGTNTVPKKKVTYLNIGNYFKNVDFFEKEVILKTIKQILSIVIPVVIGCILLFAIFFVIIYLFYKKSKPMKIAC